MIENYQKLVTSLLDSARDYRNNDVDTRAADKFTEAADAIATLMSEYVLIKEALMVQHDALRETLKPFGELDVYSAVGSDLNPEDYVTCQLRVSDIIRAQKFMEGGK